MGFLIRKCFNNLIAKKKKKKRGLGWVGWVVRVCKRYLIRKVHKAEMFTLAREVFSGVLGDGVGGM